MAAFCVSPPLVHRVVVVAQPGEGRDGSRGQWPQEPDDLGDVVRQVVIGLVQAVTGDQHRRWRLVDAAAHTAAYRARFAPRMPTWQSATSATCRPSAQLPVAPDDGIGFKPRRAAARRAAAA